MTLKERAPAKLNLSLRVLGRRADGYHEIESLVAFARFGDLLSLEPGGAIAVEKTGPFADALGSGDSDNLILRAAEAVQVRWPSARAGSFHLTKRLPVAAGLGGGSADAAAALRLLARANPGVASDSDLLALAVSLGADVPVCLAGRASMIGGIGDEVTPLDAFPTVPAVLVNPSIALATAPVFEALGAPPHSAAGPHAPEVPRIGSLEDLAAFMEANSNDLQAAAARLAPAIDDVICALVAAPGCRRTAMSGSGATCFGLFEHEREAQNAADRIAQARPDWWVQATVIG